jgi:hypothetical protein
MLPPATHSSRHRSMMFCVVPVNEGTGRLQALCLVDGSDPDAFRVRGRLRLQCVPEHVLLIIGEVSTVVRADWPGSAISTRFGKWAASFWQSIRNRRSISAQLKRSFRSSLFAAASRNVSTGPHGAGVSRRSARNAMRQSTTYSGHGSILSSIASKETPCRWSAFKRTHNW